jgi:hypothetical protein
MPARRERIYLFAKEPGQTGATLDFPIWWDRRLFFEKYGDRQIDLGNPIYVDYAILMTKYEALAFDKLSKERNSYGSHLIPAMQQLELALQKVKWVVVESYEWESGM